MIRSRLIFIQVAILIIISCALWFKSGSSVGPTIAWHGPEFPVGDNDGTVIIQEDHQDATTEAPVEIDNSTVVSQENHEDAKPKETAESDPVIAPYMTSILNANSTVIPRLQCPEIDASRYEYLKGDPTAAIPELKYFFALDLRQSQAVLPRLLGSVVEAIRFLGPQFCALSIVEGHSDDLTYSILEALMPELEAMGLAYYLRSSALDPANGDRISQLAELRNLALSPLVSTSSSSSPPASTFTRRSSHNPLPPASPSTSVIFLNDVSLCPADILELAHQRLHQGAHMTCAMDWTYVGRDPTFYDVWVARTLSGNLFFDIPADGNWNSAWNVFFADPGAKSKYSRGLPFQVFACWNGAVVFGAEPILDSDSGREEEKKREAVKFRSSREGECPMGEPTLFCKDLWWRGYGRIAVVPSVNLEYSDERASDIKALKGSVESFTMRESSEDAEKSRIEWVDEPPESVVCMPGLGDTSWRAWNETLV